MALEYLLGGVFIAAIGLVVGFWWYRYPRQARVVAVEVGLLLGVLVFIVVLVERLTADGPPWLFAMGTAAYLAVWLGLVMPVFLAPLRASDQAVPPAGRRRRGAAEGGRGDVRRGATCSLRGTLSGLAG